jgi:hypothetical protein
MAATRTTTPSLRNHLKIATRKQIKVAGGLEAAAQATRVGKSELALYQSAAEETRFMPVDVAADLMLRCGSYEILEELAAIAGCLVTPLAAMPRPLCYDMAALGTQFSAAFEDYAAMLIAPTVDAMAAARLDQHLALLIESAVDARARLQRLQPGTERRAALPCTDGCGATADRPSGRYL